MPRASLHQDAPPLPTSKWFQEQLEFFRRLPPEEGMASFLNWVDEPVIRTIFEDSKKAKVFNTQIRLMAASAPRVRTWVFQALVEEKGPPNWRQDAFSLIDGLAFGLFQPKWASHWLKILVTHPWAQPMMMGASHGLFKKMIMQAQPSVQAAILDLLLVHLPLKEPTGNLLWVDVFTHARHQKGIEKLLKPLIAKQKQKEDAETTYPYPRSIQWHLLWNKPLDEQVMPQLSSPRALANDLAKDLSEKQLLNWHQSWVQTCHTKVKPHELTRPELLEVFEVFIEHAWFLPKVECAWTKKPSKDEWIPFYTHAHSLIEKQKLKAVVKETSDHTTFAPSSSSLKKTRI